jgi:hypothetical protein
MTGKEALKRLAALKRNEWDKLEALTRDIDSQSRAPLDTLAGVWTSQSADDRRKAARVLCELEELGIRAWLTTFGRIAATQRLEAAEPIIDSYRATQRRMSDSLLPLLDDQTKLPSSNLRQSVEEKRPPMRVCDAAYLLLRQLLKADERQMTALQSEAAFLKLTDLQRDREIKRYKDKQTWSDLLDQGDQKDRK